MIHSPHKQNIFYTGRLFSTNYINKKMYFNIFIRNLRTVKYTTVQSSFNNSYIFIRNICPVIMQQITI